jgi:hypothetical protein
MLKRKRLEGESHFKRVEADWFIHLPPAFLSSPADGAHTFLGRYLMRLADILRSNSTKSSLMYLPSN